MTFLFEVEEGEASAQQTTQGLWLPTSVLTERALQTSRDSLNQLFIILAHRIKAPHWTVNVNTNGGNSPVNQILYNRQSMGSVCVPSTGAYCLLQPCNFWVVVSKSCMPFLSASSAVNVSLLSIDHGRVSRVGSGPIDARRIASVGASLCHSRDRLSKHVLETAEWLNWSVLVKLSWSPAASSCNGFHQYSWAFSVWNDSCTMMEISVESFLTRSCDWHD